MRKCLIIIFINLNLFSLSQAPILYINFVSHNEPKDSLDKSIHYFNSKTKCIQFANLIKSKNAAWNLGTCDYFIDGALNHDNAALNANDIFEFLSDTTYNNYVEIDVRTKNHIGRNPADAYYLIDSCGGMASKNLSGFTWYSSKPSQVDWFQYQDTTVGNIYGNKWKVNVLWGAGSVPAHSNDVENYGIWKPDTTTNFMSHNPSRSLWFQGNGCSPKLDTNSNEQDFITKLKNIIDSLQDSLLPANKFYCYTLTTGQDEFGSNLFNKIGTICDSVNVWGSSKIKWATISQKQAHFNAWKFNTGLSYSQWGCNESTTNIEAKNDNSFSIYPNPSKGIVYISSQEYYNVAVHNSLGELIHKTNSYQKELNFNTKGLYFVTFSNSSSSFTKKIIIH